MLPYDKAQKGIRHLPKGYCLRYESARKILHAERFSRSLGRPMTHAITIDLTGFYRFKMDPQKLFLLIRNNVQAAWRRRRKKGIVSGPFYYIGVFENPPYGRRYGETVYGPIHVHWAIRWHSIPIKIVEQIINRALQKYIYRPLVNRVNVLKIYKSVGYAMYLAKGIDPPFAKHYHLQHQPQGPIPFKRIWICNPLCVAARRRYTQQTGMHPFAIADEQRSGTGYKYVGKRRRNRLKRQKSWRAKVYVPPAAMSKLSPQNP